MPYYDFKCQNCSKEFTVQVSIKEKENVSCPNCGLKDVKQLFKKINLGGISAGSGGSCSSGSCSSCAGCK